MHLASFGLVFIVPPCFDTHQSPCTFKMQIEPKKNRNYQQDIKKQRKKKKKTCTTGIGQNDPSGIVSACFCRRCQTSANPGPSAAVRCSAAQGLQQIAVNDSGDRACREGIFSAQLYGRPTAVFRSLLQPSAAFCSLLQFLAAFCSFWQFLAAFCSFRQPFAVFRSLLQPSAVYYSLLQSIAAFHSLLQPTLVYCSLPQSTTAYFSLLQPTAS